MPQRACASLLAPLLQGNLDHLQQAKHLLSQLSDEQYAHANPATGRGRIGAHLRHVVDHYAALVQGLAHGCIDYDARERRRELETSRASMAAALAAVDADLNRLAARSPLQGIDVLIDSGEAGQRTRSSSTLARELQFLACHTVHHYAVIALLLQERGYPVDPAFGVAPSTRKHEAEQTACAR